MGQKPSGLGGRFGNTLHHKTLKLPWIFRGATHQETTHNPNPAQPIKFQYKTRRKHHHGGGGSHHHHGSTDQDQNNTEKLNTSCSTRNASVNVQTLNNLGRSNNQSQNRVITVKNTNLQECRIVKTQNAPPPMRTKSEPSLTPERSREKHRHRKKSSARLVQKTADWNDEDEVQQFGYEIQDVDAFLAKATIEKPANIPVVLAFPSVLYQTRVGGYQAEISLPLGMVVNAVFKNQHWLYVQTPHAEEGYVSYAACLPLGIIPPPEDETTTPTPCWEDNTDVFPKPSGNMTDTEKLSSKSEYGTGDDSISRCRTRLRSRNALSSCGERSVDKLYLRAAKKQNMMGKNNGKNSSNKAAIIRETLLIVINDFVGDEKNALSVQKGDVVVLLGTHVRGWFWVRNKEGEEGFIPAAVAGHGFL